MVLQLFALLQYASVQFVQEGSRCSKRSEWWKQKG